MTQMTPEMVQLMKEEMTRLHEILKTEKPPKSKTANKEKDWAMKELTKFHEALHAQAVFYDANSLPEFNKKEANA